MMIDRTERIQKWRLVWMLTLLLTIVDILPVMGQDITYLRDIKKPVDLPFEYYNNFIVINVRLHGLPMKFVLDTGAEHTILLQREITDLLGMRYDRRVRLMGADMSQEIYALTLSNIQLSLEDRLQVRTNLVVLEEDFVELDRLTGVKIHGIIGASILRNFVVKIDYRNLVITLYRKDLFDGPPKGYYTLPVEMTRHKPYLTADITMANGHKATSRLLIDSGAAISALFYVSERNALEIPEKYVTGQLGVGLGGSLLGYLGRVSKIEFGEFKFNELIANFQDVGDMDTVLIQQRKDGLIGNVLLNRFTIIIDYKESKIHLKPNKYYKKKISYDKSGLILINSGENLRQIAVLDVMSGSPAESAGIEPGDIITHYQNIPIRFYSFEKFSGRLQGKSGKKIKLKIQRGEEKIEFRFHLKQYI
jgi:predicted aspartyl protease